MTNMFDELGLVGVVLHNGHAHLTLTNDAKLLRKLLAELAVDLVQVELRLHRMKWLVARELVAQVLELSVLGGTGGVELLEGL